MENSRNYLSRQQINNQDLNYTSASSLVNQSLQSHDAHAHPPTMSYVFVGSDMTNNPMPLHEIQNNNIISNAQPGDQQILHGKMLQSKVVRRENDATSSQMITTAHFVSDERNYAHKVSSADSFATNTQVFPQSPQMSSLSTSIAPSSNQTLILSQEIHDNEEICLVCGDVAFCRNYGATSCRACGNFFRNTIVNNREYVCKKSQNCLITKESKNSCPACRMQKCFQAGMSVEYVHMNRTTRNRELCSVCGDLANCCYYGVISCASCGVFFRTYISRLEDLSCKNYKTCAINKVTRKDCRYCRMQKCLQVGMHLKSEDTENSAEN